MLVVGGREEKRERGERAKVSLRSNSRRLRSKGGSSWLHWVLSLSLFLSFSLSIWRVRPLLVACWVFFQLSPSISTSTSVDFSIYLVLSISLPFLSLSLSLPEPNTKFSNRAALDTDASFPNHFLYLELTRYPFGALYLYLYLYIQGEEQQPQRNAWTRIRIRIRARAPNRWLCWWRARWTVANDIGRVTGALYSLAVVYLSIYRPRVWLVYLLPLSFSLAHSSTLLVCLF